MKLEQAARQALEAMDLAKGSHGVMLMSNPPHDAWIYRGCDSKLSEAITALREALAEQERKAKYDERFERLEKFEQETISSGLCGGCAKKAADGWALYCVECWEQAEQRSDSERMEPVACKHEWFRTGAMQIGESRCIHCGEWNYTAPVRTKDLTDDEIYKLADDVDWAAGAYLGFARAVIAADREKNK